MMRVNEEQLRERFDLNHGQFFAFYRLKNQRWHLNGEEFGFGDVRDEDLERIKAALEPDDVFEGYNEHHGSDWQQRSNPMVRVTPDAIEFLEYEA